MSNPTDRLAAALSDRSSIERELGAGGMATVYLAHDLKHDRRVGLKVLKPELAGVDTAMNDSASQSLYVARGRRDLHDCAPGERASAARGRLPG